MAISTITSFAELLALLTEQTVPHAVNQESWTVEIPIKNAPLESVCYIRWEKELPYVQVICPFALAVPAERHREVETAIIRANNAIPFPGFGLDVEHGTLYFRYTLAVFSDGISALAFQKLVLAVMSNAREFVMPFRGVIDGQPGADILKAAIAYAQSKQATPAVAAAQKE